MTKHTQPWTGYLRLALANKHGRTIADDVYYQGAFKLSRPIRVDEAGQPGFYMMNPGGGYVDGDRYGIEVALGEQAAALLTTQSSTKIYRTVNRPVVQDTRIVLKRGSVLEYIPDPLIAYKHARYEQRTVVHMEQGAAFISAEIITPGWSPDGRPFRYDTLRLKTEVFQEGELIVYDHLKLEPDTRHGTEYLEGHTHYGSMLVIGEAATPSFLDTLYTAIEADSFPGKVGLSMLAVPGFTVRVLAMSTQQIERLFEQCHRYIRHHWFGKGPLSLRKY